MRQRISAAIPMSSLGACLWGLVALVIGVVPATAQSYLYVVHEGSRGGVVGFRIEATGTLTAIPIGVPTGPYPVSIAVDPAGRFAYVANYNCAYGEGCGSNPSSVAGYRINPVNGTFGLVPGGPFPAGVGAYQVTVDPTGKFAYVANFYSNDLSAYSIDAETGALSPLSGSPFPTGGERPVSVVVEPTGRFLYVQNFYTDSAHAEGTSNVAGFQIDPLSGALTSLPGSPFELGTGSGDPSTLGEGSAHTMAVSGHFLYAANSLAGTVTAYRIQESGSLTPLEGSPFPARGTPSSVTVDPSGRFAYVPDGVSDAISAYRIDTTGSLNPIPGSPFPGGGARPHMIAVAPSGAAAYAPDSAPNNDQPGHVAAYNIRTTGALAPVPGGRAPVNPRPVYAVAVAIHRPPRPGPDVYADSFESPTLDPGWQIVNLMNETIDLSQDQNHTPGGLQSLRLVTIDSGIPNDDGQHNGFVQRVVGPPTPGTVSVYFYDNGPAWYTSLAVINSQTGALADVGTQDFDDYCYRAFVSRGNSGVVAFGPNANCGFFPMVSTTDIPRTYPAWHKLTIASTGQKVTLSIDDQVAYVYEGPLSFDTVQLSVTGPWWRRPLNTYYFDDFLYTRETTVVAAPAIQCDAPDGRWHASDATIACVADSPNGLVPGMDAAFSLTTRESAGTETGDAATDTRSVCSVGGACATAGPVLGNRVDKKPPEIELSSPKARVYRLDEPVAAAYSCADLGSGLASCTASVPNGGRLDTSTPGLKTFVVTATDAVGNASTSKVTYKVQGTRRTPRRRPSGPSPQALRSSEIITRRPRRHLPRSAPASGRRLTSGTLQRSQRRLSALLSARGRDRYAPPARRSAGPRRSAESGRAAAPGRSSRAPCASRLASSRPRLPSRHRRAT
jgi:6-phosphogluconolactonase (cycloisomerase 2 family)